MKVTPMVKANTPVHGILSFKSQISVCCTGNA